MPAKSPALLTADQRAAFVQIPPDLPDREIARHYTLTTADLAVIARHRQPHNRLGFAVQLCLLRFPGRTLTEVGVIPPRVLAYIAAQVQVDPSLFPLYGQREPTLHEHMAEIRQTFGYRDCAGLDYLHLARLLLPDALAQTHSLPLIEIALVWLRAQRRIAPGMTTLERLVGLVQRRAERQVMAWLVDPLTPAHRAQLNALFQPMPGRTRQTRWGWLRQPPSTPSAASLHHILERLAFLTDLHLPPLTARVHRNRVLLLARHASRYEAQPLAKLREPRRYALLAAYLSEFAQDCTDQAVEMFERLMGELLRKGERRQEEHFATNSGSMNAHLSILTDATEALLKAHSKKLDAFDTVFATVAEATLAATVVAARKLLRPVDGDYLDLIEPKYTRLRGPLLAFYGALRFQAVRGSDDPALRALDHVQHLAQHDRRVTALRQRVAGTVLAAPFAHVTRRWRKHMFDAEKKIRPNYYEAAAFDWLQARLRSGDIAVLGSRRYRTFESYLLPKASWRAAVQTGRTGLEGEPDVHRYLATAEEQLRERLTALGARLGEASGLTRDEKGKWHLRALKKIVPDAAIAARRRVYAHLPRVPLAELLLEVDAWTGFLTQFTHLVDGAPPTGEDRLALVGALMGLGLNQGLHKMAEATPFTYHRLAWASEWHIREETLLSAQAVLDNFVLHRPLARAWGDGTRSSSDGMRVKLAVRAANADPNPEYFGLERGVTFYGHLADIDMPFGRLQVIHTNDREALYVIDALCHHESEFRIREHYTDTAGSTAHVFGLCRLLNFQFAPRIKRVLAQHLYTLGGVAVPEALASLVTGRIHPKLIVEHWDELRWVAASIKQGTVSAALLLRKLAAYPRQNRLAQALAELGKLEETLFLVPYLSDEEVRRRVGRGLSKGEAKHALERALFFGRRGELWERAFRDQVHRGSCLQLLVAAIGAWNTVYLEQALTRLEAAGQGVPAEYVPHIAPLGWEHINLLGRYSFEAQAGWALDNLRPLRRETEIEVEDDGDRPTRRSRSRKPAAAPSPATVSPVPSSPPLP